MCNNIWKMSARFFICHISVLWQDLSVGINIFSSYDLGVWPIYLDFNLVYNLWTMSAWALIFHMKFLCNKILSGGTNIFPPVTLTFVSGLLSENFNLSHNCWTVSARIFIIHKDIPCDKAFLLVLNVLNIDISSIFYKTKHFLLLNNKYQSLPANVHFLWQDLSTAFMVFALVTFVIFGHDNYWEHVCFTKKPCLLGFLGPTRDFFTDLRCYQYWRWDAKDQYSALILMKQRGFFRVLHLLWHGSSVYMVINKSLTLTPVACRGFVSGAVTTCSKDLGLSKLEGWNLRSTRCQMNAWYMYM